MKDRDIIIFQSGYCTQDLGGNHPLMHFWLLMLCLMLRF